MRKGSVILFAFLFVLLFETWPAAALSAADKQGNSATRVLSPSVRRSARNDRTIALRDMKPFPIKKRPGEKETREIENRVLPKALMSVLKSGKTSTAVQNTPVGQMPSTFENFEGIDNLCSCLPPDTNGDVGPNDYVQMVNDHIQVFDKNGNSLLGPEPISTLWQGFGGVCESQNNGDPIVLYDQLAGRWLVSQFAIFTPDGGNHQCVAISQTGDPTGAYYRYDFDLGTLLNDYPHLGVWSDGYYMSVNQFNPDFSWAGAGVYSFERDKMLLGQSAQLVYFDLFDVDSRFGGMLPSDLDGPAPAAGTPDVFAEEDDDAFGVASDRISLWNFHVDWAVPTNSTFGINGQPNTHVDTVPFDSNMCDFGRSCIPQPGTNQGLDAITDRLMHRLQYRSFNGFSTLVGNHTVDADGTDHAGIHWFELSNSGSGWTMNQEGVYAPDGDNRWMGSVAMDSAGNIALGYSVSGSGTFPSIRYTGRLVSDPPGQMTQAENTIIAGSGSQLNSLARWGDYSGMAVDPSPGSSGGIDCDFWYTTEYIQTTGNAPWLTRVGAFSFAPGQCGGPHGDLQGTVRDNSTSLPIAGGTVRVQPGGFTTTTDANGLYHLTIAVGVYDVTASDYGYFPQTQSSIGVSDGSTTTQDFSLDPAPHVTASGTVNDNSGHGWPLYARIDIEGYPFGPVFTNPITGAYSVDLIQDAPYTFKVSADGYNKTIRSVTPPAGGSTQNFLLTVDFVDCHAPGYSSTGGLVEDFDSGVQPTGWTIVDNKDNGQVWTFVDQENQPNKTGGTGLFAVINSDFYGQGGEQDSELRTPVLNFSSNSEIHISYDTDFRYWGSPTAEVGDVDVSTDGGSTWTNVHRYQNGDTVGPHHEDFDISAIAGNHSNVMVRFHYYNSAFSFWWQVDDVRVGVQCAPVSGGLLAGNVYDSNTGTGLNGAVVSSDNAISDKTTALSTTADPNLEEGFYILFSSLTGNHPFTASNGNYLSDTEAANVIANQVVQRDFHLAAGKIVPLPTLLEDTVALGTQDTQLLTLQNTGGAPAGFRLYEGNGNTNGPQPATKGAPVIHIDGHFSPLRGSIPGTRHSATKTVVDADTEEPQLIPTPNAPPWTAIADYPTTVADPVCAEISGKIYCTGGTSSGFAVLTSGNVYDPVNDSWSPIADMSVERDGPAGVAIGGKLYITGGRDFSAQTVNKLEIYDPGTNSWSTGADIPIANANSAGVNLNDRLYVIGGCDIGTCGFKDVQVYDPVSNTWTTAADYPEPISWNSCGAIDGLIYCAGGTAHNNDSKHAYAYDPGTNTWTRLADMPQTQWGAATLAANGNLYLSGGITNNSSTATNEGFAYDPSSDAWRPIPNANNATFGSGSACGLYKIGGTSGVFANPVYASEVLPGLSNCGGGLDVPWISENPDSGVIPGNTNQPVNVTFDASQVIQPGDYFAHLRIKEDTPYSTPDVQVKMHVPLPSGWGYLAGVVNGMARCDVGGSALSNATVFVDTNGTDYTVQTDANGQYKIAYNASDGPTSITISANGYIGQTRPGVQIIADQTHTEDFLLRLNGPCIDVQPVLLEDTVTLGSNITLPFTMSNSGAADADFQLLEGHGIVASQQPLSANHGAPLMRIKGHFSPLRTAPTEITDENDKAIVPETTPPWLAIADYPTTIMDNSCVEIESRIYCVGGMHANSVLKTGYVYDPGSNSWSPIADMSVGRQKPAAAAIDGLIYVAGGWSDSNVPLRTLEIYDPVTNVWYTGAPMLTAYGASTGVNLNGKFYVVGGCPFGCGSNAVQVYDPGTDSWSIAANYPELTSWNACGAINGLIYCAGGIDTVNYGGASVHTYSYVPGNDKWTQLADMPQPGWGMGYIAAGQRLIISGGVTGQSDTLTNEGFAYDPSGNTWTQIANSNNTVFRGGSACGFYKIGGSIGAFIQVANSEVYPGLSDCGDAVDIPWLSENPTSGNLAAETGQQTVDVTFDAAGVNQPGDYIAHLRIKTDYTIPNVQAVMHVPLPLDWGTVQGTVTGLSRCDAPENPLRKATVFVDTNGVDYTLKTDANGNYHISFPISDGPATITVSMDGYAQQVRSGVTLDHNVINVQNFDLRLIAPCGNKSPASFDVTLNSGQALTLPLTLGNTGAGAMNYYVHETSLALLPSLPDLPWAITRATSGGTGTPGPLSLQSLKLQHTTGPAPTGFNLWLSGPPVPGGLARYAHAQCDNQPGSFYVFTGVDGVVFENSKNAWRYDDLTKTWNPLAPMPAGSQDPVATCYQGRIYVMGGSVDGNNGSALLYVYDISSNSWFSGATLPRPVWGAAAGSWNGKVYLVGGDQDFFGTGTSTEVDIYDIATNTWTGTGASMPVGAVGSGFVQAGPQLYIAGGWHDGAAPASNLKTTQRYDMASNTWSVGPDLLFGRADFALTITDKALYAMGGDDDGGTFFDPTMKVTRMEYSKWPSGIWKLDDTPLPAAYTANNAGFCTQASLSSAKIWSLGGISAFFGIDGTAFYRLASNESCYSIFSDVAWLSESPVNGSLPADSNVVINVTFDAQNLPQGDYHAVLAVSTNDSGATQFNIPVTLHVSGLFSDDFNDGDFTTPAWTMKSITGWDASSGDLAGTTARKINAISPDFGSGGCTNCTIVANMDVNTAGESLSLFGWRSDSKNYVEVRLNTGSGKLQVTQKSAGNTVAKHTSTLPLPAGGYNLQVSFDGTNFTVQLSGAASTSFTMKAGATPKGTLMFRVKAGTGTATGTLKDVKVF